MSEEGLARDVDFEGADPIVVVNVAWRNGEGQPFAIGTDIPSGHDNELLHKSLEQSAQEAEDALQGGGG